MACKKGGGGKKKLWAGLIAAMCMAFMPIQSQAEQTILAASAVRAATYTSADIVKSASYRGIHVNLQISAVPGGDTVTPKIQGKDASGNYYDLLVGTATAATGTNIIKVYPGAVAVPNAVASDSMPDVWRVIVTHSAASNFTYTVNYNTLY